MSETELVQKIRLEASKHGITLFRNNVGALKDINGRLVRYGLSKGSSDLIGWRKIHGIAQFIAIEVKSPTGTVKPEQLTFINAVLNSGGLAGVCRSVEDFLNLIK
jgi:hypothetical protein